MSSKRVSQRTVFVLDVSGSMRGKRLETLNLAVKRYIVDVQDGHYVGIVLFESKVWIEHEVVQITSKSVRDSLIAKCPQKVYNDNDFEGGLMMGLKALREKGLDTEGATLIFVTDGEDTWSRHHYGPGVNYVDKVLPELLSAKVRVVCIAIGHSADPNLERIAKETNGKTYFASDNNREMAVSVFETAFREVKTTKEMTEALTISVCNQLIAVNENSITKKVVIDADIGLNTYFTIGSENIDKFSVSITSPNGHKYDSTSSEFVKSDSLKRYQLKLKSAEEGIWTVKFERHSNQIIFAMVSVMSQPLNPNAIQMRVWLKDPDINTGMPPLIFVEIRKGNYALIGAEVTATIDKPNATQTQLKLKNYNNIYCNYFTDYCGPGRYNVCVLANCEANKFQLKSLTGSDSKPDSKTFPQFERQQIVGCFKVSDFMPSKQIDEKKLEEISHTESVNSVIASNSWSQSVEAPAPRNAKAPIARIRTTAPQKLDIKSAEITKAVEEVKELYLVVKRLIGFSKLPDSEKQQYKREIERIESIIFKSNIDSINEVENCRLALNLLKEKL